MAQGVLIPQIRRKPYEDEYIGMGFNNESQEVVGTAFEENIKIEENPAADGQNYISEAEIISSHEELMTNLGLSAEVQGKYSIYSGSLKTKFAEEMHYNSISTFVVARCIVSNSIKRGIGFKVKDEAKKLLEAGDVAGFMKAYGDSFVRALVTGGELYAVIRITSSSADTQHKLATTLSGEVDAKAAGVKFSTELEYANKKSEAKTNISMKMFQSGGKTTVITDIGEVMSSLKKFPEEVAAHPRAFMTELAAYDTIGLQIPRFKEQEEVLSALSDARDKQLNYTTQLNDLEFALQNPTYFENLPAEKIIKDAIGEYKKLIKAVGDYINKLSHGRISSELFEPENYSLVEPAQIMLKRITYGNSKSYLKTNEPLKAGDYLVSPNLMYFAVMQSDGNFCVYKGSKPEDIREGARPLWCSGSNRGDGQYHAIMQSDGNFCIYKAGNPTAVWCSKKYSVQGDYYAIMQSDGNFCVYYGTDPEHRVKGKGVWGIFHDQKALNKALENLNKA